MRRIVVAIDCLPEFSTGFTGYEENDDKVKSIVTEMFGTIPIHEAIVKNNFGQGHAVLIRSEADLPKILREHLQPDFEFEKPLEPFCTCTGRQRIPIFIS